MASSSAATCIAATGSNMVGEVPALRWDTSTLTASSEAVETRRRHGGFLHGVECFANGVFVVSSAEAAATDPQQRLLLERGYAAMHVAEMDRAALQESLAGVFVGISFAAFEEEVHTSPIEGNVYAATGIALSIASGRLSYALGLQGPCLSIETACSSALAASHSALTALRQAECRCALAAGVNLMLCPIVASRFAIAGMTSPLGRSHTFDDRAGGYARGEACSGIALRCDEGWTMLGLLGSAVRQDGRSASLTAPNGQAQQGLLTAALNDASTMVDGLVLNEAHGTGTALGDPIEAGSLVAAVLSARKDALTVGGVKASIGHAEPAAGMTGLLKLASGLRACEAAPNAQLRALNPYVGGTLRGAACVFPMQLAAATIGSGGLSSFGYGGTIVHAVLSETTSDPSRCSQSPLTYRWRTFLWQERVPHSTNHHEWSWTVSNESAVPCGTRAWLVGVAWEVATNLGVITLNNPSQFNGLDEATTCDFSKAVDHLEVCVCLTCVVLQGVGAHFCVGGNSYGKHVNNSYASAASCILRMAESCCRVRELSSPVVAAVHGHLIGGGIALGLNSACMYVA